MLVVMVAIFYFLLIRPENKRKKQAQAMRDSVKKGDAITTIGGMKGKVIQVTNFDHCFFLRKRITLFDFVLIFRENDIVTWIFSEESLF